MAAKIIDGIKYADDLLVNLQPQLLELANSNIIPKLVIILIGDNAASRVYVRNKLLKASKIGIEAELIHFAQDISEQDVINSIYKLNSDNKTHGIIVQMPLPEHIDKFKIISAISHSKDVDGFHPINVGLNDIGSVEGFAPCTPLAILHLIKSVCPDLSGKNAVIIGRSTIVGRPLASLLLNNDATVTICHSRTKNLQELTSKADIVVTAVGVAEKFGADYFASNQIVIDVGINKSNIKNKLVGDVKFDEAAAKVAFISPVPGGVGPMTVAFLMANTIKAATLSKLNK